MLYCVLPQPMEFMMIQTSEAIKEVAALSAQAAEIAKQHAAVMSEIRDKRDAARGEAVLAVQELVGQFELTAADIKLSGAPKPRAKRGEKKARVTAAPKYRSPDGISTWSGRGRCPLWFSVALASGKSADSMLIHQAA